MINIFSTLIEASKNYTIVQNLQRESKRGHQNVQGHFSPSGIYLATQTKLWNKQSFENSEWTRQNQNPGPTKSGKCHRTWSCDPEELTLRRKGKPEVHWPSSPKPQGCGRRCLGAEQNQESMPHPTPCCPPGRVGTLAAEDLQAKLLRPSHRLWNLRAWTESVWQRPEHQAEINVNPP